MGTRADLTGPVDTTDCDREPIHIPGSIQPHGMLLIADAADDRIVAGAGDLEAVFGDDWLGASIDDLLRRCGTVPSGDLAAEPGAIDTPQGRFDIAVHRGPDHVLVELEAAGTNPPMVASEVLGWLDAIVVGFDRASDLAALCDRAATAFRTLTGYDRVMIYRFLDDDAGRVVAQDAVPEIGSFLNHHFPASDIPRQARALYVRNRARAIPDIAYAPQPIRPAAYRDTDLADVGIRSVSPIHIEYLENMGVAASASISIVKDGVLWGLVACHHRTPRPMPRDVRQVATTLAGSLARQIRAKEDAQSYRERLRLRTASERVIPLIVAGEDLRECVARDADQVMAVLGGDGLVVVCGTAIDCHGHCPDADDLRDLVRWLRSRPTFDVFATESLGGHYPDAPAIAATASGILAMPLIDEDAMLVWLRAEQVEEVAWAGNPHKAASQGGTAPLTPRASFDSWTELVRGRARRWQLEEMEAAHRLRRAIHDGERNRRIRELADRLQRSVAEKDALLTQKDVLMKEVDHRVQNSLQLVAAFLAMQARNAGPGDVATSLAEAQSRLSAVALVHRRLYRDDQIESVDLSRYLGELADDLGQSLGTGWAERMRVDLAPILIPTDRAVSIGLILTELVINATKYAYDGDAGPIDIVLEQHRRRFRLIVADHGRGMTKGTISARGGGFGSRMMTAIVQRIEGEIDLADNQPGTRAILTAPIGDVR